MRYVLLDNRGDVSLPRKNRPDWSILDTMTGEIVLGTDDFLVVKTALRTLNWEPAQMTMAGMFLE